jgi:hypothetical protein
VGVFQRAPGFGKTRQHELRRPIGIMDIARPMKKIQKLSGLCDGAKQGVVAAGALLVLVEPHRRALGVALGGLNRTIEIQCHPR